MEPYLRPEGTQLRQGGPEPTPSFRQEANPLALLLAIAADPRNSWMGGPGKIVHGAESLPALIAGLGPLFKSGRGWEVLKEYINKGGTPKSLRDLLRKRGYESNTVDLISSDVRHGTDIAAPSARSGMTISPAEATTSNERGAFLRERYPEEIFATRRFGASRMIPLDQQQALEQAVLRLKTAEPQEKELSRPRTAGEHSKYAEQLFAREGGGDEYPAIPSGTQGQAAYQAIASRMARLMDDPNFLSIREHYLPPPVSDQTFWAATRREPELGKWSSTKIYPYSRVPLGARSPEENAALEAHENIHRMVEQEMRQRRGLAPPQSFGAAENQRTSNLNRRADQRQNNFQLAEDAAINPALRRREEP